MIRPADRYRAPRIAKRCRGPRIAKPCGGPRIADPCRALRISASCLALLAAILPGPRAAHAKALLGEPEVDRASDQYDGLWCPAEQIQMFDGAFTADGPRATLQFVATNHSIFNGDWRHERIDNIVVVPANVYAMYKHLPDSALAAAFGCLEPNKNYFHFSEVPAGDIVFLEKFPAGPGPAWDLAHGAYANPGSSALNALALPLDTSGQSLGLGLDAVPTNVATTEVTFQGLTAGQDYVVSTWTQCADASVGSDLVIRIYGTEFFTLTSIPWNRNDDGRGCAWGDYDGDGDPDLLVTSFNSPSALWRNLGNGTFQDVTTVAGISIGNLATAVSWVDVNNDGHLDLYVASHGQNRYYRNRTNGTFTDATSGPLGDTRHTQCMDWADYDLDGDLDLFLGNLEADALLRNDGTGFVDVASGALFGSGDPAGCSWVDYDDDGDSDLFVTYDNQPNELFVNSGGAFAKSTPAALAVPRPGTTAAWADFDEDGDLDAYLTSFQGGNRLCRNDGAGAFTDITTSTLGVIGAGIESVWGDWNNDGHIDLYLAQNAAPNRLFRNDGGGAGGFHPQTTGTVEDPGSAAGASWVDYDLDGDVDAMTVKPGPDALYRNEFGSEANWLHVDLAGAASNRFGVGAKIFVTAGGATQMREVGGESGFRSQNSLTAEFGLGTAGAVDLLRVEWPSGITQTLGGITANQRILVEEHAPTDVDGGIVVVAAPEAVVLHGGAPNPFRDASTISYELARPAAVELRVLDVRGRVIRRLDTGLRDAGEHRTVWDGRDRQDRPVAPGIYFLDLRTGERHVTRKLVRVGVE